MSALRALVRRLPRSWRNHAHRVWRDVPRVAGRLPVDAPCLNLSVVYQQPNGEAGPSERLLTLALEVAARARGVDLSTYFDRAEDAADFLHPWPGEHYRFLAALVDVLRPTIVVEVGTSAGYSALALMHSLPENGRLVTFDLIPWDAMPTVLRPHDFAGGRLQQRIGDLCERDEFERQRSLLESADLLFVDGPKDRHFEPRFFELLSTMHRSRPLLTVVDDIRVWNMLRCWQDLDAEKLDVTSLAHWSGTGMCLLGAALSEVR